MKITFSNGSTREFKLEKNSSVYETAFLQVAVDDTYIEVEHRPQNKDKKYSAAWCEPDGDSFTGYNALECGNFETEAETEAWIANLLQTVYNTDSATILE